MGLVVGSSQRCHPTASCDIRGPVTTGVGGKARQLGVSEQ